MDIKEIKTPILEKHSELYKIIIPQEVERKIRHLCNKVSTVEWSGTLFYTSSGSYEDNNLEIRCVDIFLMDIGSSTYTEFDMSPDVIAYMAEHPELLDCQCGLIHSHNNMATFFSGTDLNTLKEEGKDRNHFVSLIVNNEGTYTAAITRKLITKRTISTSYSYKSFDDIEKTGIDSKEVEEEVIAYNYLEVIKEGEPGYSFDEVDTRLKEIKEAKEEKKLKEKNCYSSPSFDTSIYNSRYPMAYNYKGSLFDEEYMESSPVNSYIKEDSPLSENTITFDESHIKSLVLQLITGSVAIADSSRIEPMKWANQMVPLFDKRFKDIKHFNLWIEMFAEFVLCSTLPEECLMKEEDYISELCTTVYEALEKLPSNKYITSIKETLTIWM